MAGAEQHSRCELESRQYVPVRQWEWHSERVSIDLRLTKQCGPSGEALEYCLHGFARPASISNPNDPRDRGVTYCGIDLNSGRHSRQSTQLGSEAFADRQHDNQGLCIGCRIAAGARHCEDWELWMVMFVQARFQGDEEDAKEASDGS